MSSHDASARKQGVPGGATFERWPLAWDHGSAEIFASGASLHNLAFRLDDGMMVQPLAEAPWIGDSNVEADATVPAHLKRLGGEWPCVPFGTTAIDPHHHGYGADHAWHVVGQKPGAVTLAIDYPEGHPVRLLERRVTGVAGEMALELELTAEFRHDCTLPVGLHPIFRLPDPGRRLAIEPGAFASGNTFPRPFEPGISLLAEAAKFATLDAAPLSAGDFADLSRLPAGLREELVQLAGVQGGVRLVYPDDGYAVRLDWSPSDFPSLVIWLSDGGRKAFPWRGRFRGLGIEPVAAFFDDDGLAGRAPVDIARGRRFSAGERWTTRYRISVCKT